jgi:hypothetical protein
MTVYKVGKTGESEAQFRKFLAQIFTQGAFVTARSGVVGNTGLGVAQTSTASASVTVDRGLAMVQDSATAGAYPMVNDSAITQDVLTANPMGGVPRNDIVVIDYATESVRVIVGTPNAVPTDPTVPTSAVALARLRHAAGATTVPSSVIDDLRVWLSMRGGIVLTGNQTERDALFLRAGDAAYRSDLDAVQVYDGAGWDTLGNVSDAKAGKRAHWGTATVSIGTDGFVTAAIAHGAGFTPTVVICQYGNATGSVYGDIVVDQITSTTFRARMFGLDGATPASTVTGQPIMFFCGE